MQEAFTSLMNTLNTYWADRLEQGEEPGEFDERGRTGLKEKILNIADTETNLPDSLKNTLRLARELTKIKGMVGEILKKDQNLKKGNNEQQDKQPQRHECGMLLRKMSALFTQASAPQQGSAMFPTRSGRPGINPSANEFCEAQESARVDI